MTLLELIRAAIREDMPQGDKTTDALGFPPRFGQARLIAKQDMVLSGVSAFEQTLTLLEPEARVSWAFHEGNRVLDRQVIANISGDLIQILKAERVALNFLGHLSGIATLTREYVDRVSHTRTRILDTRKTLPGYRELEKRAVVHGGGISHRASLSHAILIKDNHIALAGGVSSAIRRVRASCHDPIEVECENIDQVVDAVAERVHRILLDNMDEAMTRTALALIPPGIETEASGNMTLERVGSVAELGVQWISVGALTHSAPVADLSLEFGWSGKEMTGI